MKKILYHGSDHIIEKPAFGVGTSHNDYGRGFYCTENLELAKEWACAKNEDGFANMYELDMNGLAVLNLNQEQYHILNWLAVLTRYRSYWQKNSIAERAKDYLQQHFLIDISQFDVVIGNRADDSYFSFAQDFVMGVISLEKLSQAMKLGNLGEQVVLISEKAFAQITYTGNDAAYAEEYFNKKEARDREARRAYRCQKITSNLLEETFILDIMRKEMTDDEVRIRSGVFATGTESTGRYV
ncbi:MAG: DUF3990 domain-containing protein [Lachnospira sp.]|nr:DUF3990 domain-containing protein [Lachnospira sp.]